MTHIRVLSKFRYGKVKHRIIFDAKESGLSSATSNPERVLLPRVADILVDTMELLRNLNPNGFMEFLVLDFSEAFWQLPTHPKNKDSLLQRFRAKPILCRGWLRVHVRDPCFGLESLQC